MRRELVLGLAALASLRLSAPSFAAEAIRGSVAEFSSTDGHAIEPIGFRIWSALPGGTTLDINFNTGSCTNMRCMRTYVSNAILNPGGFIGNQENTVPYNSDAADQPFYELADASMNDGAGNHIGYFGVAGVTADVTSGTGSFLAAGCAGTQPTNCFGRLDNTVAGPPLAFTNASYGGPSHTIRAIGGLNPIPTIRVDKTTGDGTTATLTWNGPPTYDGAMRPGVSAGPPPSPVLGLRLWKFNSTGCIDPAGNAAWVDTGMTFGTGPGTVTLPKPVDGSCDYYALTVRFTGPGGSPNEVETFRVGAHSQAVSNTPTAVRIVHFDAEYAGHGIVNVNWQSGLEGGLSGFYLGRSQNASGPYARVSELIRAKGDNSNYSTTDRVAAGNGRVYYYRLEVVGRDGSITTSSAAAVTLPTRSKKAGPAVR